MQSNDITRSAARRSERGFSLIEILIVVALIGVVAAMAVPITKNAIDSGKSDSAVEYAINALDTARDRAVAERRNFVLVFDDDTRFHLERQEIDAAGTVTGTTVTNQFTLENGQEFHKFTGMDDTPDGFGNSTYATFTGTAPVMFTSDGSLVDSNGDITNGTILFGIPNRPETARAVTIFGVTGLMRAWKWRGDKWME